MSIRRKVGRFRAVIAAGVLALGMLAVVPASTQSAIARDTQPTIANNAQPAADDDASCTPSFDPAGYTWATRFNERGVTLCQGTNGLASNAFVQIIDLSAGAKLRMVGQACSECPKSDPPPTSADRKYYIGFAEEWFNYIPSYVPSPDASRLFSTSNASFFTDTSGAATPVSLPFWFHHHDTPHRCWVTIPRPSPCATSGSGGGTGWAFADHEDPAWDAPKKALILEDVDAPGTQNVYMEDFPTHYTYADVQSLRGIWPEIPARVEGDNVVGFQPNFDGGTGLAARSFVGVSETGGVVTKVYILNTGWDNPLTVTQAQNVLKSFGSGTEIQLDGGGSTQLYADTNDFECCFESVVARRVPTVLAVYLAP